MELRTMRDVGAFVKDARKRRGLTQAQLADRAGVGRRWLSSLEAGKARADLGLVLATFAALAIELHADDSIRSDGTGARSAVAGVVDLDDLLSGYDEDDT